MMPKLVRNEPTELCIFSPVPVQRMMFAAFAALACGNRVSIWCRDPSHWQVFRQASIYSTESKDVESSVGSNAVLLAIHSQFTPPNDVEWQLMRRLSECSRRCILLGRALHPHLLGRWKHELRVLARHPWIRSSFSEVMYEDGPKFPTPFSFFFRTRTLGGVVSPEFFLDADKRRRLWTPPANGVLRPFVCGFQGNVLPCSERERVVKDIEGWANVSGKVRISRSIHSDQGEALELSSARILWAPFSAESGVEGVSDYLDALDSSVFSLCLPGYHGTTMRVLESILRGSIPVLSRHEVRHYGLPLVDGSNCLMVDEGKWVETVERICCLRTEAVQTMQINLEKLRESYCDLIPLVEGWSSRLGLRHGQAHDGVRIEL